MKYKTEKKVKEKSNFLEHLKISSSIVSTWPTWKQEVLGKKTKSSSIDNNKNVLACEENE